jgi:hypothetical protein
MCSLLRIAAAAILAAPVLGVYAQAMANYDLSIVAPANDATVFSDSGNVTLQATVAPALAKGDQIEFLVDGQPAGAPTSALDVSLAGLPRGQHVVQARILDSTGNVGAVSTSSIFYVWQASTLFPNRTSHP